MFTLVEPILRYWREILGGILLLSALWTLYGFYYVWWRFCSYQGLPSHFAFAGAPDSGILSRLRSSRKSFFGLRELLWDGYQQVSYPVTDTEPH